MRDARFARAGNCPEELVLDSWVEEDAGPYLRLSSAGRTAGLAEPGTPRQHTSREFARGAESHLLDPES